MHNPTQNHLKGFSLSLITAIMWGILPIALKELLAGMNATTIVWYRFLVAGVVLFTWLVFNNQLPAVRQIPTRIRWMLFIAAIALCINYSLFSFSLNFINAETSEAVIQLTTLFLILGGVTIYKEPFFGMQKLGTALIVVGLLLFFNDRLVELVSFDNRETIGVVIVVFSAITWTIYALLQKQLLQTFSSVQILFLIYAFSIVVFLPFIMPSSLLQLTQFQVGLLLFCCINTLVAYGCFTEALNSWDASKVSAVLAMAPLVTIGSLKLIVFLSPEYEYSDRLSIVSMLGVLLLIVGSVLIALMPVFSQRRSDAAGDSINPPE